MTTKSKAQPKENGTQPIPETFQFDLTGAELHLIYQYLTNVPLARADHKMAAALLQAKIEQHPALQDQAA